MDLNFHRNITQIILSLFAGEILCWQHVCFGYLPCGSPNPGRGRVLIFGLV